MFRSFSLLTLFCVASSLPAGRIAVEDPPVVAFRQTLRQAQDKMRAQEYAEAAALWAKVVEMNPVAGQYWSQLGQARYQAKDYRKAIAAHEKAMEMRAGYPANSAYDIACCYTLLGEKAQALQWLEKALDMGFRDLQHARTDSDFESIRSDPKYRELTALADTDKMTRDEGWRYDLRLLARELKRLHYDPFKHLSRAEFDATVQRLHDDIPKLKDNQIAVGFIKLAQRLGDGHTRLAPAWGPSENNRSIPAQFYLFTEGLYITAAAPEHKDLIGAQVLRIGEQTVDQTMTALDPLISRDNAMWPKLIAPTLLRNTPILNGLGLIPEPDKLALTIRDSEGKERSVTLPAMTGLQMGNWETVRKNAPTPEPLYLKKRQIPYWFEYLPESKTVFFQYNAVQNAANETLEKFCDRLFMFISGNDVERLVIDMRWNGGGNNFLNTPLTHGLIRCDKINKPGKLFVIVGRNTFSAAMCGATHVERHTNAIFVGEPTGSSPNFVGESILIALPYSKMRGSVSDLYWQNSVAMDYRTWIAPTLYAPPSFALYRANRDPAMEAIMAYREEAKP